MAPRRGPHPAADPSQGLQRRAARARRPQDRRRRIPLPRLRRHSAQGTERSRHRRGGRRLLHRSRQAAAARDGYRRGLLREAGWLLDCRGRLSDSDAERHRAVAGREDTVCSRNGGGAALGVSDRRAGPREKRALAIAARRPARRRHGRLSAFRFIGGAGRWAHLRRDLDQWRHHGHLAGWPPYRAPSDARSDDDEHLLWRPGHEDRIHYAVLDRTACRGRLALARIDAQSGWLKRASDGASRGSSAGGATGIAGRLAAAAFSRSRREIGCGTQGRSPRLSFAPTTVIPSASSHNATAPWRQVSIRSATGILPRQANPAGTCATIASTVSHDTGNPLSAVTIATRRP